MFPNGICESIRDCVSRMALGHGHIASVGFVTDNNKSTLLAGTEGLVHTQAQRNLCVLLHPSIRLNMTIYRMSSTG